MREKKREKGKSPMTLFDERKRVSPTVAEEGGKRTTFSLMSFRAGPHAKKRKKREGGWTGHCGKGGEKRKKTAKISNFLCGEVAKKKGLSTTAEGIAKGE